MHEAFSHAQSAQRGYLVTGDPLILSERDEALSQVASAMSRGRSLLRDNPQQQQRLLGLEAVMGKRIAMMREQAGLKQSGAMDGAALVAAVVSGASRDPGIKIILSSCLQMAKDLDITSIAEGVETQEDWQLLSQLGCTLAQGYLIAKPMPVEEVKAWSEGWAQSLQR